jgi:ZIP family zinc transporter
MLSVATLLGSSLVAIATVAGAWLARRCPEQRQIWFAAAAGALLIIVGLHLLPDALAGARAAGVWTPLVPIAAIAAFIAARMVARAGCGCREHKDQRVGSAAAAALAAHRFLEGAAIALAGSATVAIALAAHAFAEGLAAGALLGEQPRRRVVAWLSVMCLSPLLGAVTADVLAIPESVEPVLLAVAGGILIQAAWMSLRTAFSGLSHNWLLLLRPFATSTVAAAVTVLAVRGVG